MHKLINDNLAIGLCNIQGGLTSLAKTLELQELVFREQLDIIGINETNLKSDIYIRFKVLVYIYTSTLNLPLNFDFLRCDRPNDKGRGGCGMLVNQSVNYKLMNLDTTDLYR